jgi:exodeoxyribonuclease VII small subunit
MAKAKGKAPEEMTYELAFQELGQIVESLESGKMPLDEALALFERGQALADRCGALLEQAELRLKQLVPDERGEYREEELDLEDE